MLERGGMRGGGWCDNSVKTSIFKNSVSSLITLGGYVWKRHTYAGTGSYP
jgi:hypothetical protein